MNISNISKKNIHEIYNIYIQKTWKKQTIFHGSRKYGMQLGLDISLKKGFSKIESKGRALTATWTNVLIVSEMHYGKHQEHNGFFPVSLVVYVKPCVSLSTVTRACTTYGGEDEAFLRVCPSPRFYNPPLFICKCMDRFHYWSEWLIHVKTMLLPNIHKASSKLGGCLWVHSTLISDLTVHSQEHAQS